MALAAGDGRRVLVTGGNKGIGWALCRQLVAEKGFQVLLASRDGKRGEAAVQSIVDQHPECAGKIRALELDVSSGPSVAAAAEEVAKEFGATPAPLYGIVNNAGVGFGMSMADTLEVNAYGTKRVCDAFLPLLDQKGGRIVNTASASGPMFLSGCDDAGARRLLTSQDVQWKDLDGYMREAVQSPGDRQPYGLSKACVNAYTMLLAREQPDLKVNSMTPGFILTDITRGMGASKSPEEGTKAALHCLMGELEGNGRYYGSDAVRSPLHKYRNPGDPPYTGE
uniref:Uncharacterized protein n=1 Tax=Zooxanthella nutricula TaxID=1333877 RepID=A0A7S2KUU2_9DINO